MSTVGLILTLTSAFCVIIANLMLRHAMSISGFNFSFTHFIKLFLTPIFTLGLILYLASMVVWLKVLTIEKLSSSYPILVSMTFLGITLGAALFFKETISLFKLIGIVIIVLGIIMVARS